MHPHGQVLTLDIGRADVLGIGLVLNFARSDVHDQLGALANVGGAVRLFLDRRVS